MTSMLVAFLALAGQVASQTTGKTTAVCTYAQWTSFQGNSPCKVWANLQAACDPNASVGVLDTPSNPNAHYPTPSGSSATPCQCNVVAYNLMAGCSWCQPNVYSKNWVDESEWKSGCSNYNTSGLPSQASSLSSHIPPWAFEVQGGGAWLSFEASTIAAAGGTPTATAVATSRPFGPTGTGFFTPTGFTTGFSTYTGFPAVTSARLSGGDFDPLSTVDPARTVGITVGVILGCYVILGIIVLAVVLTRQKNRKAWYGPTAKFYRDGGRMVEAGQPMLGPNVHGQQQSQNSFMTPSPTTSPASAQYDPNLLYAQGAPGYHQQHYDPHATQQGMYHTGYQQNVVQV